VTILTGTERTMARAMRSAKLTEIKNTDEGKKMLFSRDRTRHFYTAEFFKPKSDLQYLSHPLVTSKYILTL